MKASTAMEQSDFSQFQEALDQNQVQSFVQKYVAKTTNISLTEEDTLALALMKAIKEKNPELIRKILFSYPNKNILTNVSYRDYSPLSYALSLHKATGNISKKFKLS